MVLRLVVFGSGAVLMGLEIVGSRILAPYFGSSVYVWGSLISIFLAALSLGYYLGGMTADRWPKPGMLAATLSVAGVLILLLPVISRPVLEAFSNWDFGPRMSPLLASIVLFVLPSILMGATSPFAIKLAATDLATVGHTAGILYAISTAGSIVGTLLTAFVLIPAMGVRAILYTLGASLLVFAGLLAVKAARARVLRPVATAALALIFLSGPVPAQISCGETRIVFEKDTVYHRIKVAEDRCYRWLHFDRSRQGGMFISNPLESPLRYPDYFLLAWLFHPGIKKVLVVGLGSGSVPKRLISDFPGVQIDSVELDPVVVDVAKRYFSLRDDPRHRIFVQDGRQYIKRTGEAYDLIVMDAYHAEGVPFHLVTREFFQQVKTKLRPGGIVAANIVGFLGGANSKLFKAIYKTYAEEFSGLYLFPVTFQYERDEEDVRTIILFAAGKPGITKRDLTGTLGRLRKEKRVPPALKADYLGDYYDKPISTADVPVMTDDHSFTDILPVWGWEPERR
ncbi:MAG: fused MFS/spermidine synthase [Armatimonadetes bacterium]|nr:fused MFS/spermidine synthase [Armatimonadota bacterium]